MPRREHHEEDDAVALRELPSELERHGNDDNGHQNGRNGSSSEHGHETDSHVEAETQARQRRESRKRALVLVGSAISQLPIWGEASRSISTHPVSSHRISCHAVSSHTAS